VSSYGAVLDACVLICAPVRDTLLRAAALDLYRPQWSEQILNEVTRNLIENAMVSAAQATHLIAELRLAFPEAEVTGHEYLIASMTNHPKDRHVVAAAVEAGAQIIVTFNRRDFPTTALAPHSVEMQHPDEFLTDNLFRLDPDSFARIVIEQAADLRKPPVTLSDLQTLLETHVPRFATRVRQYLIEERNTPIV
jgi:predicted nucleic acid-binding protein